MSTTQNQPSISPNFIAQYMGLSPIVYFLVSFITGGMYFYYFQYKLGTLMKRMNMEGGIDKVQKWFAWSMIIRVIWIVAVFVVAFTADADYTRLLRLILVPAMVFEVMWSFKVRSILSFHVADKYKVLVNTNGVFLFFFPGLALTVMFNSIQREIELLKVLRGGQ